MCCCCCCCSVQFAPTSFSKLIPHACPEACDLMTAMCQWDPNKRPTAVQCLQVRGSAIQGTTNATSALLCVGCRQRAHDRDAALTSALCNAWPPARSILTSPLASSPPCHSPAPRQPMAATDPARTPSSHPQKQTGQTWRTGTACGSQSSWRKQRRRCGRRKEGARAWRRRTAQEAWGQGQERAAQ